MPPLGFPLRRKSVIDSRFSRSSIPISLPWTKSAIGHDAYETSLTMTIDGFLTVLTLAAAVLTLLSPVQRLRLSLAWPIQLGLAFFASAAVIWLELKQPALPCPSHLGRLCTWITLPRDTAQRDAFLIVLGWGIAAYVVHRLGRVGISAVPALARVAGQLLDGRKFEEFLQLVLPQRDLLVRASRRRGWWQNLHDRLREFGLPPNKWIALADDHTTPGENWPKPLAAAVRSLSKVVPAQAGASRAAEDLLQALLNSGPLLDYLAEVRPHAALALMSLEVHSGRDFAHAILERLIAHPGSALYQELEQNQNTAYPVGYVLPERNRVLHYLFADVHRAESLSAWMPIGNYIERLLDGVERNDYRAWLNGPATWFEKEWWRDPTFCCFFYFDIMVTSAMAQDVADHMWLPYFPHFVERLERLYQSDGPEIDRDAEFPTRAARLLYEAFRIMTGWIEDFTQLPEGSPHRIFPQRRDHPNANIPLTASIALTNSLRTVIMSDAIDDQVVQSLYESVLSTIRGLGTEGAEGRLRAWVVEDIIKGGWRNLGRPYRDRLRAGFVRADYMLQAELEDYHAALQAPE